MSEQLQIDSHFRFYPLPPLSGKIKNSMVYSDNILFLKYYRAYSKPIDKHYYLDLYDKRKDNLPYKPEILGEELGYLHNVMVNDIAVGLLYYTLMSKISFDEAINRHFVRFMDIQYIPVFPSTMLAVLDLTQIPKIPFFEFFNVPKYNPKLYIKYTAQQMPTGGRFEIIQNYWTRYSRRIMNTIPNLSENYVKQKPEKLYRFSP
jgi:hypothetical protein